MRILGTQQLPSLPRGRVDSSSVDHKTHLYILTRAIIATDKRVTTTQVAPRASERRAANKGASFVISAWRALRENRTETTPVAR